MHREIKERIDAGLCFITLDINGSFLLQDGLGEQSVYVVRSVIKDSLNRRLEPLRPVRNYVEQMLFDEFPFSVGDGNFIVQVALVVKLERRAEDDVERELRRTLIKACAAVLFMMAEQHGRNQMLSSDKLETLFQFVEDAPISEQDIAVASLHAA